MQSGNQEQHQNIKLIEEFRRQAQALEPDEPQRRLLYAQVGEYTHQFLNQVQDQPGYTETPDLGAAIERQPISEGGTSMTALLELYETCVDYPGSHPTSPAHFAYIPACGNFYSALGDYLAAISNRYSGTFFAGPGAVRMENLVIKWLQDLVGYPGAAEGNLTSGGSIANLTAIVAAREAHGLIATDYHNAVIYISEHTHHSIAKALHIAGMGSCQQHIVPVDDHNRMRVDTLKQLIETDRDTGLRPWMVAATAGTTNLGSIDPLASIGSVARENDLWFHVDAAYGGFFMLSELVRDQFDGIEHSDSVVLDPHKSLFIPFGSGAVLVRDGERLRRAHHHTAHYMQDAVGDHAVSDPSDLGPELTRHFRALRIWMPLKLIGTKPFASALSEKVLLSRYAYDVIRQLENFEVGPAPELSIFVFRYVPADGKSDEFNKLLVEALRLDGRVFFSSTVVNGQYMIRFPLLSFRTHRETVDTAIAVIRQTIAKLETQ